MSNNLTHKKEWQDLKRHAADLKKQHLNNLFVSDENRFDNFSIELGSLFFDYSKQRVTDETIKNLSALGKACDIEQKRDEMFKGEILNNTESRAVLHTALRRPASDSVVLNDKNVMHDVHETLQKMQNFSDEIRSGQYLGATGKPITQIVSIGVGGSDLGPRMVYEALKDDTSFPVDFMANIDGDEVNDILERCNPEQTLFIVISKSFGTQETLVNAKTSQEWLLKNLPANSDVSKHFVGVSANIEATDMFGIKKENCFPMWDWVNGRFSLWSAVGLPICIGLSFDRFKRLLDGAYEMDCHFLDAPVNQNMPMLMALIGIWNRNFLNYKDLAILPYSQKLSYLPLYFQQLEMESNGKTVDLNSQKIEDYKTNAIIFGEVGTNGQHSFYQLLHQGSDIITCDFIGAIKPNHNLKNHHDLLLNNMLAQGQALMQGQQNPSEPFRYFEGNRPSSTLLLDQLDAKNLGMLIALYEHKCFVQGIVWNINSFDQFGVELGKQLAKKIEQNDLKEADSSTSGLFSRIHKASK